MREHLRGLRPLIREARDIIGDIARIVWEPIKAVESDILSQTRPIPTMAVKHAQEINPAAPVVDAIREVIIGAFRIVAGSARPAVNAPLGKRGKLGETCEGGHVT